MPKGNFFKDQKRLEARKLYGTARTTGQRGLLDKNDYRLERAAGRKGVQANKDNESERVKG